MLGGQSEPDTDHQRCSAEGSLLWHQMVANVAHDGMASWQHNITVHYVIAKNSL